MSKLIATQRDLREKIMFAISVALFAVLNLVPGLLTGGGYALADYGGGGGACPSGCPGGTVACCQTTKTTCEKQPGGVTVCVVDTYYYHKQS